MKVIYTSQSIVSLEESLRFLMEEQGLSQTKAATIKTKLFNRADSLILNPNRGQREEYLQHLKEDHRRIVEGNFKIIYKIVEETIYIVDFFDTRQDPEKMKF
jgi:plasmid stabilization system protein ParE